MQRRSYPSDLSEREWAILEPLIPPAKPGGHPRTTDMREVINAILYVDRTGCQWRALPHEFPPWSTVWSYFRKWRNDGTWKRMHTALREQVRIKQGRQPTPSAAIIDRRDRSKRAKKGAARLRWREEGQRPQAPSPCRHERVDAARAGARGQHPGPQRRKTAACSAQGLLSASQADVGR
jgi:putative transposase